MSLVSTWVEAIDGRLYQNPVLTGPGWFVCFDDDDPAEIVATDGLLKTTTFEKILSSAGFKFKRRWKGYDAGRIFNGKVKHGGSLFFDLLAPMPIPTRFDAVIDERPRGEGVLYLFSEKFK